MTEIIHVSMGLYLKATPDTPRGESRGEFGLNRGHCNDHKKAKNPTNIGDPNHK